MVVDLGLGVALRADSSDEVEAGEAAAGPDGGVPNLVGLACGSADAVGGVVGLSGRADAAAESDEVVSGLADALAVDPLFVGIAGGDAESEVGDEAVVADALLGDCAVGGVHGAGGAGSIGKFEELRQADALLESDAVDSSGIAGDSADAEALIVDLVPFALAADAVDGVVPSDAAALSIRENFVESAASHTETALVAESIRTDAGAGLGIKGGVSGASGADSVDEEEGRSTAAGVVDSVVDLVGSAGNSADLESHIEEVVRGAGLADAADEEESSVADALLVDEDLVGSASACGGKGSGGRGGAGGDDAVAVVEGVSLDAVAGSGSGVVDGEGGAGAALSSDGEES